MILPRLDSAADELTKVCDGSMAVSDIRAIEPIRGGWEATLYRISLASGNDLVVRRFSGPSGSLKARREHAVLEALTVRDYPAPQTMGVQPDHRNPFGGPFVLIEYLSGAPMMSTSVLGPLQREDVATLAELLVQLHEIDGGEMADQLDQVPSAIPSQVERALGGWRHSQNAGIAEVSNRVLALLRESKSVNLALNHWDFHPGNVMVSESGDVCVIDWGSACVGDSRFDVAWSLLLARSYLGSIGAESFQSALSIRGKNLADLEPFEAFGCLRRLMDVYAVVDSGHERAGLSASVHGELIEHVPALTYANERLRRLTGADVEMFKMMIEEISS